MSAAVHVGEHEAEPVRGLPEVLPAGESIVWQGSPDWWSLARTAFHVRKVAVYFALLVTARGLSGWMAGEAPADWLIGASGVATLGGLAVGILCSLAWLNAVVTVYTITDRRVVLRIGVALTMAINLPFTRVQAAQARIHPDGSGDVALDVVGADRIGFWLLWPHVRPWSWRREVQPMLRGIPRAESVGRALSDALAESGAPSTTPTESPAQRARSVAPAEATAAAV